MKSNKQLLIFIFSIISSSILIADRSTPSTKNNWKLEWEEDFNGDTLDTSVWNYMGRQKGGSWKYHSKNPECYTIKDGILTLRGIQNTRQDQDTAEFITGGIYTKNKKSFPPGKFEIKAKFNSVSGGTVALWLMPFNTENGWPTDGEIDIMEHGQNHEYITHTQHTSYTKKNPQSNPIRYTKVNINIDTFNVYGVEVLEDRIDYFVNYQKTFSYPKVDSLVNDQQYPFYKNWYILLNTNLGATPSIPIDITKLPIELEIDWIKYYRKD